jgi:hypothetical protein
MSSTPQHSDVLTRHLNGLTLTLGPNIGKSSISTSAREIQNPIQAVIRTIANADVALLLQGWKYKRSYAIPSQKTPVQTQL